MKYKEQLEKAFSAYDAEIERIAKIAFDKEIKPYLVKYNLKMFVGNGAWYICDKNMQTIDNDELPDKILNILNAEVNHPSSNDVLGCFMPDYQGK